MKIETVKITELISPDYNPRYITPEDMEKLENSLREFGYVDPLIVNKHNNHIVGGNQRYNALKNMGYNEVDVIFINEPSLEREKALNVALNKISGDFDLPKLEKVFQELELKGLDLTLTGFDTLELNELNLNLNTEEETTDDIIVEDDYEIPDKDEIEVNVKHGEIYSLGNHRLMCGDSTIEEDVQKLMNNNKADLVFTDPHMI